MQLYVGLEPPEGQEVSWMKVNMKFKVPIKRLGGWYPDDIFSNYEKIHTIEEIKFDIKVPELLENIEYLNKLLPQLSINYRRYRESTVTPMDSVIRSVSNGQGLLIYDLYKDPKTNIDPRQFKCQILFGIEPNTGFRQSIPLLDLLVNCQCGALSPKAEIEQTIDIFFRSNR
jgi:hypothetical protein